MKNVVFLVLGCLILLSGCGQKLPPNFPKVYPMTITVVDGDTPLTDVRIMFYLATEGGGAAYASTAYTDAKGVAKVNTTQGPYIRAGIPAGEYVVTVDDDIKIDLGLTPEQAAKLTYPEEVALGKREAQLRAEYKRKVPAVLCKPGKVEERSPLRFTATEGKNELTVDVAQYK